MMTKRIRPCTIEDEQGDSITIDALDVTDFDVLNCMLTIEHQYQEHLHFPSKSTSEIFRMFNAKLYEALNAPVLVTQEVLDTAKEEYLDDSYYYRVDENARFSTDETFLRNVNPIHLLGMEILPACPLSLDFLLKFYTDGTPVKRKEDNDGL